MKVCLCVFTDVVSRLLDDHLLCGVCQYSWTTLELDDSIVESSASGGRVLSC